MLKVFIQEFESMQNRWRQQGPKALVLNVMLLHSTLRPWQLQIAAPMLSALLSSFFRYFDQYRCIVERLICKFASFHLRAHHQVAYVVKSCVVLLQEQFFMHIRHAC